MSSAAEAESGGAEAKSSTAAPAEAAGTEAGHGPAKKATKKASTKA